MIRFYIVRIFVSKIINQSRVFHQIITRNNNACKSVILVKLLVPQLAIFDLTAVKFCGFKWQLKWVYFFEVINT